MKDTIIAFLKKTISSFHSSRAFTVCSARARELVKTNRLIVRSFSAKEKLAFLAAAGVLFVGFLGLLFSASAALMVEIPARGGAFSEGIIGAPRFINPVLAISDTDRDLTGLVYSGLLRATPEGTLIPDLADRFTVSPDGMTYTFTLKDKIYFHDGTRVTSADVLFTIEKIQDSVVKSPKRASWEGIIARALDEKTIEFKLERAYSPFLENATVGILPKHIWSDVAADQFGFSLYNTDPIGSGPFKIKAVKKSSSGIPEYYDLVSFRRFALGRPYINDIRIRFYSNAEDLLAAFKSGSVEAVSTIAPKEARDFERHGARVLKYTLPRIFGVFLNQNQNIIFTDAAVRKALNESAPKEQILEDVLSGYGTVLEGPLPPGSLGFRKPSRKEPALDADGRISVARATLESGGWKMNEKTNVLEKKTKKGPQALTFSIATSDAGELKNTAEILKATWEKLGAHVELKIFQPGDLNQNVIRPRKYDALLFGEIIGRESDPFAFWHSSQRNDPGLNIALYANIAADKLLEEGRTASEYEKRDAIYQKFEAEVKSDIPFVATYSPDFLYLVPRELRGIKAGTLTVPSERFLDVYVWYENTARVWRIFADEGTR